MYVRHMFTSFSRARFSVKRAMLSSRVEMGEFGSWYSVYIGRHSVSPDAAGAGSKGRGWRTYGGACGSCGRGLVLAAVSVLFASILSKPFR